MKEKLLAQLSEIFELEIIDLNEKFKNLDMWDSLTALSIIALADSEYQKKISNDNFKEITTIEELIKCILNYWKWY